MEKWIHKVLTKSVSDSVRKMTRSAKNECNREIDEINDEFRKIVDQGGPDLEDAIINNHARRTKLNNLALKASYMRDRVLKFVTNVQKLDLGKFKINAFEHHAAHNLLISLTNEIKKLKSIQMKIASELYLHDEVVSYTKKHADASTGTHRTQARSNKRANDLKNIICAHIEGKAPAARKRAAEFYVDEA